MSVFLSLPVLFGSQAAQALLQNCLEKRRLTDTPDPGKPRVPEAADSDKLFLPRYALPYET